MVLILVIMTPLVMKASATERVLTVIKAVMSIVAQIVIVNCGQMKTC